MAKLSLSDLAVPASGTGVKGEDGSDGGAVQEPLIQAPLMLWRPPAEEPDREVFAEPLLSAGIAVGNSGVFIATALRHARSIAGGGVRLLNAGIAGAWSESELSLVEASAALRVLADAEWAVEVIVASDIPGALVKGTQTAVAEDAAGLAAAVEETFRSWAHYRLVALLSDDVDPETLALQLAHLEVKGSPLTVVSIPFAVGVTDSRTPIAASADC